MSGVPKHGSRPNVRFEPRPNDSEKKPFKQSDGRSGTIVRILTRRAPTRLYIRFFLFLQEVPLSIYFFKNPAWPRVAFFYSISPFLSTLHLLRSSSFVSIYKSITVNCRYPHPLYIGFDLWPGERMDQKEEEGWLGC